MAIRSAVASTITLHGGDLRVEHRVDADERRADDVPVDVLQRQPEIDQRHEPLLEDA